MIPFLAMQQAFLVIFNNLPIPFIAYIVTVFMILGLWSVLKIILGVT